RRRRCTRPARRGARRTGVLGRAVARRDRPCLWRQCRRIRTHRLRPAPRPGGRERDRPALLATTRSQERTKGEAMTAPLLKDVFTIPDATGAEDYVLRLTDATTGRGATEAIDDYVVTPDIADAFDNSLALV